MAKLKKKDVDEFEELMKELGDTQPTPYATDSSFTQGEFLQHKVFGIGKVIDLIKPDKMTVHFEDGQKVLICVHLAAKGR